MPPYAISFSSRTRGKSIPKSFLLTMTYRYSVLLFPVSYEMKLAEAKLFWKLRERNLHSSFLCHQPLCRFGTFDGQEECCSEVGFLVLFGLSLSFLCVSLSKQESAMSCFYCFTTSLFKLEKSKYWIKTLVCRAAGVRQGEKKRAFKGSAAWIKCFWL